jgi:Flp pilus assembly protein TadG
MRIRQLFRSGVIREFARSENANIALVFSLALLPIVTFVGAAIDYSRANAIRSALQSALDSTTLILAKEASGDSSIALNANAVKYFNANFTPHITVSNIQISATYSTSGGSKVVVNGSVDIPTTFLGIVGFEKLTLSDSSTSSWGNARLRVALALDNTGSMADSGKMAALQSSTHSLLNQLKAAASQNGDVYVSIIPFSKDVNVGSSNKDQNWIDWSLLGGTTTTTGTCTSGTTNAFAELIASLIKDAANCAAINFIWTAGTTTTTVSTLVKSTWNGCITDRKNAKIPDNSTDYDQSAYEADPSILNSLFPAENYSACPVAMMGLTYDWTSLNALVDSMKPAGNTNQPIGLVWAWQSLVGGGPLSVPPLNSTDVYQTYIILLSDGLNTEDRFSTSQSGVDARMYDSTGAGTCANIKGAGITIYTIQVNTGGDPTSTLLKKCASKSTYFYEIKDASQLAGVFKDIGTGMTRLRIAK